VTISQTTLKTLHFCPKGQLTSVTLACGTSSAIVTAELVIRPKPVKRRRG